MSQQLVLSCFPGIGLLDMAFEEEGFTVVRGPDLIWGGDIRRFHPPAGRFDGVIGGPPCQAHGGLANLMAAKGIFPANLIPEYSRVVTVAAPDWWLMENVATAPDPTIVGYGVSEVVINNRWFGEEQSRKRKFWFGSRGDRVTLRPSGFVALEHPRFSQTVTSCHAGERRVHGKKSTGGKIAQYTVEEALRLQGLPPDFFGPRSPLRRDAQLKVIAEGVPLTMGRAIARAVKAALGIQAEATA